ncbi:hypothetical protein Poli38472_000985 [Pythium oligandrum]|uniref:Uncharacterized protein n=1 Tax=Pythium oligandrum TaxID=41045 RepID=A0A8K1FJQ0_PYTOL|nr:hypothetical protein Poli38472_000985 [Pythium oligandrum]|eukprot:TMW60943.1 hypothetical protein Poli38472_000985 [Pythium oligandrum]
MGGGDVHAGSLFRVGDNVELWRVLEHLCFIVLFIIIFEQFLHALEHKAKKHAKYHEIMSKVFGELMILGFIGLGTKAHKEIAHLNAYSKPMITFQAADIMVFVLAIALIIQATSIFMNLRSKNIQAAKAELISSVHLDDMIKEEQQKKKTFASRLCSLLPANYFYRNCSGFTVKMGSQSKHPQPCMEWVHSDKRGQSNGVLLS